MSDHSYASKKLHEILERLGSQEPLPAIGSADYHANYTTWKTRREQITEAERVAELEALSTIPPEIEALLHRIRGEVYRLYYAPANPTTPTESEGTHE
jgi:hypothetical protein